MLNNKYFYYRLIRKYVILFGNMFNNITFKRFKVDGSEIQRLIVPLIYAPKDKMVTRLLSDPDLLKETQTTLPRMSFDIVGISYDASRKQNSLLKMSSGSTGTSAASQYMGVPYDLEFELYLYTKNIDDGTQIAEQILPYFNPDYTVTINPVPEVGFLKDIPIILNDVNQNIQYEGNYDSVRFVNWTFRFTIKAFFFGPVNQRKIIRKSIANIFNDIYLNDNRIVKLNLASGNGTFTLGDTVYQGSNYSSTSAYGIVKYWSKDTLKINIETVQGNFTVNNKIHAVSTNAVYTISSFDATPNKVVNIVVEPDPIDAQPGDDYGYTTTITEWADAPFVQPLPINNPTADSESFTVDNESITADAQ